MLLDEIELVGSYSLLQRGRSYAELARWLGHASGESYPGLVVVGMSSAIISPDGEKKDRDYVAVGGSLWRPCGPRRNRHRLLERECTPLNLPTDIEVRETISCEKSTAKLMAGMLRHCRGRLAAPGIRTECATKSALPSTNGTCCDSIRTLALKSRATSSATRMKRTSTWNGNPKTMPNGSRIRGYTELPVPFDDLSAESTHSGAIAWLRFLDEEDGEGVRAALFQTSDQGEPLDFCFSRIDRRQSLGQRGTARPGALSSLAKSLFQAATSSPILILGLADEVPPSAFTDDIRLRIPFCRIKTVGALIMQDLNTAARITNTSNYFGPRNIPM